MTITTMVTSIIRVVLEIIMGKVVELSAYRETLCRSCQDYQQPAYYRSSQTVPMAGDSQVPVEFAVGIIDRQACLQRLSRYGIDAVQQRVVREPDKAGSESGAVSFSVISVTDAIRFNKRVLEREDLNDDEIADRIDIIQMLENLDQTMMDKLWTSFTRISQS